MRNLIRYIRSGGVVYVNVSMVKPSERFVNKKVFITGGTSGIGLETAKEFLSEGAEVLIGARNKEKLKEIETQISNPNLHILDLDVSDVSSLQMKVQEADILLGGIDIFVNCAGVSDYGGKSMDTLEMYDYIININERGLFFICKVQGEYFLERKIQGKIINITSKAGERIYFDPYVLSKWGANAITKGLARKLAKDHIIVNGIAPGCVPTNITAELQKHKGIDNMYREMHETKRFTMVEEIASLVLYLSSDIANNIVGQIINVDGGIYD